MFKQLALLGLAWIGGSAALWADGSCHATGAEVAGVHRLGEVIGKDRLYLQDEPKECPARGGCAWRRKAYIVLGDRVDEEAVSGAFSCVTYHRYQLVAAPAYEEVGTTTGWVPSAAICVHPPLRKARSDPKPSL